ncbi:MAG TPA: inositol monophosphatase [Candidatus Nanoarchaeia archaeon]|nr:inositol monophosphatase [Candidatus Nanoarchaeia archaeon]
MKNHIIRIIRNAGKIAEDNFGKIHSVKEKAKKDLVTEVDFKIQKTIVAEIRKKYPSHSIIAEEKDAEINTSNAGDSADVSKYVWYVDPLDGTHNYLYGIPIYGISISVFYNNKPKIGVIYLPHADELYFAEKGRGAFLNEKRIHVSRRNISKAMILATSSISTKKNEKISTLSKVADKIFDYRAFGCATYALTAVASGKADAYILYDAKPWDIAAGFLILEEAGGKITDTQGKEWSAEKKDFLATNGKIQRELLKLIK